MKKLLFLSVFALFALASANVFGQAGQGLAPSIGSIHEYWVNANADGSAQNSGTGSTYSWWISKNGGALLTSIETPGDATADFTVNSGTYGTAGATDNYKIKLTWNPSSSSATASNPFYLVVKEVNAEGCANIKAVAIIPKNNFQLVFAALDETGTAVDNNSHCAPDISLSATGTDITYNYGTGDYQFKLSASGLYTSWSFTNAFANDLHSANGTIQYKIGSGDWNDYSSTTNLNITVPANPAGSEVVYFKVHVVNGSIPTGGEEGKDGQTMKLTLSGVKDAGNNPVTKIFKYDGTTEFGSTVEQTQTVKARPNTSNISSN
jgi:hypothetical protein